MSRIDNKQTVRKNITPRRWITVNFGFSHHRGNRRPYFSITGSVYDKDTGDRRDSYIDSCGCIHDQIAEHFPELAHLIRWHLTDDDATPMHYIANGAYWLEFHHGISAWEFDKYGQFAREGRTSLDLFKSTVVWREGVDTFGDLLDPLSADAPEGVVFERYADIALGKAYRCKKLRARVEAWAAARPDLLTDMKRDMEAAGVVYLTDEQIAAA